VASVIARAADTGNKRVQQRVSAKSVAIESTFMLKNEIKSLHSAEERDGFARRDSLELATRGTIRHDDRGTAVWNWAVATGVLAGSKVSELLQMLDNPDLQIAGDGDITADWAGDPYNRR
jgi:hypothetical protein